jgi:hypothetical protein
MTANRRLATANLAVDRHGDRWTYDGQVLTRTDEPVVVLTVEEWRVGYGPVPEVRCPSCGAAVPMS